MFFTPVVSDEVLDIILSLNNSSPGWDEISSKILKTSIHFIIEPLTCILNMSLCQGIFPDELKIAKIVPIFKSENNMFIQNYRPISVLPVMSKVFEKIIYKRLVSFINKNKIYITVNLGLEKNMEQTLH